MQFHSKLQKNGGFMAKVLIGYSACPLTRAAFEARGHQTWTCDLLPSRDASVFHIVGDVWEVLGDDWDFAVLHPMCTYLTVSAAWAFGDGPYHQKVRPGTLVGEARREARREAVENFKKLLSLPYPVAIENPGASFVSKAIRRPSQIIHPHQFGDDASKATGLWLSAGVPHLTPTASVSPRIIDGRPRWANQIDSGQNRLSPGANRWLERSATYPGIAAAMGDQWGRWLNERT